MARRNLPILPQMMLLLVVGTLMLPLATFAPAGLLVNCSPMAAQPVAQTGPICHGGSCPPASTKQRSLCNTFGGCSSTRAMAGFGYQHPIQPELAASAKY